MPPAANHLWQSSVFAGAIWIFTLALKRNRAAVRYALWLGASVKFLVPFSILAALGHQLPHRAATLPAPPAIVATFVQPFTLRFDSDAVSAPARLPQILLAVWLAGIALGLLYWVRTLLHVRALRRAAVRFSLDAAIPVLCSPAPIEPGVFGIVNPVVILPAGLADSLTPDQLTAVLAHELCHVRRRDNLTAAIHMLVETIFWFHPLVWWIRRQLVAERELACDEAVVARAADPQTYAEAILNVCKLTLRRAPICVSGIHGASLKHRIARIVAATLGRKLSFTRKLFLGAAAATVVVVPVAAGLLWGQPAAEFEVISIKPYLPTGPTHEACNWHGDPGMLSLVGCPLRDLIALAYDLKTYQLPPKMPAWTETDRFVVQARSTAPANRRQMMGMLQPVLADRFHLKVHWAERQAPVYLLTPTNHGPKLQPAIKADPCGVIDFRPPHFQSACVTMDDFAEALQGAVIRDTPVLNRTGAAKDLRFQFSLEYFPLDDAAAGPSIFSVLPEQLGLTLKAGKAPVRTLILDHAERPLPN